MVIKLFGYRIHITRNPAKPHLHIEGGCKVMYDDIQYMLLTDPDGYPLPGQVDITIHSRVNEPLRAWVLFNISGMEENLGLGCVSRQQYAASGPPMPPLPPPNRIITKHGRVTPPPAHTTPETEKP